jgi:hypothetical protein
MNASLKQLADVLESVAGLVLDYALVVAAVGTMSMAIVELIKAILPVRLFYHWRMVDHWISRSFDAPEDRQAAWTELLSLTAGRGDLWAVWTDQPNEKMCVQLQSAARIVVDAPASAYPRLRCLLGSTESATPLSEEDRDVLNQLISKRHIEMLQGRIEWWWTRGNQLTAMLFSGLLLWLGAIQLDSLGPVQALSIAILGGIAAPFAKSVADALMGSKFRQV